MYSYAGALEHIGKWVLITSRFIMGLAAGKSVCVCVCVCSHFFILCNQGSMMLLCCSDHLSAIIYFVSKAVWLARLQFLVLIIEGFLISYTIPPILHVFLFLCVSGNIALARSYMAAATMETERNTAMSLLASMQALGFILGPGLLYACAIVHVLS